MVDLITAPLPHTLDMFTIQMKISIASFVNYTSRTGLFIEVRRLTVLHQTGAYLPHIEPSEVLLEETKPVDGQRMFWFGRGTLTAYWFVLDEPALIYDADSWFRHQQEMINAHNGNLDEFCDM